MRKLQGVYLFCFFSSSKFAVHSQHSWLLLTFIVISFLRTGLLTLPHTHSPLGSCVGGQWLVCHSHLPHTHSPLGSCVGGQWLVCHSHPNTSYCPWLLPPWCNHTGWLGVKHQVTYLLTLGSPCSMLFVDSASLWVGALVCSQQGDITGCARSLNVWGKWDKIFKTLKVCENWVGSVKVCEFGGLWSAKEKPSA